MKLDRGWVSVSSFFNLQNFWNCGRKRVKLLFSNLVREMEKIRDYGWEKGETSERKVCQVLEELKAEGKIKNFGWSSKFSQEDSSGRDFLITTNDEKIIWLQIKSSFHPVDQEKYRRRGIYYIAVQQKSDFEIREEILGIIRKAIKPKRRPKLEERIKSQI